MKTLFICLLALISTAQGAEYWCNPNNVSGTTNGTSPATGWIMLRDVPWTAWDGAGPKQGDTLSLCTGTYTNDYINILFDPLYPAAAGIVIRAATNAGYTGIATLQNSVIQCLYGGITLNGNYNGATNIIFQNVTDSITSYATVFQGANHIVTYCGFSNCNNGVSISGSSTAGKVSHCWFQKIRTDFAVAFVGMNVGVTAYDQAFVHNCRFDLNIIAFGQGEGPDGIQGCPGLTMFSNTFAHTVGTVTFKQDTSYQHSDYIQCGSPYQKIFANDFLDPVDSSIDRGVGGMSNLRIYDNTFRQSTDCGSPSYIRLYRNDGEVNSVDDLVIANNTFIDHALNLSGSVSCVGFLNFGTGVTPHAITFSGVRIVNNIFLNCGRSGGNSPFFVWPYSSPSIADFGFDYNLFNAGVRGVAANDFAGTGSPTQPNGQSSAPVFVSYSEGSAANNLHLASNDSAARGNGTNVAGLFTVDKDFVNRSNWDLGAYEYYPSARSTSGGFVSRGGRVSR